jgi:hypothetical protein
MSLQASSRITSNGRRNPSGVHLAEEGGLLGRKLIGQRVPVRSREGALEHQPLDQLRDLFRGLGDEGVSLDGVFDSPQKWGLADFRDDAYLRDGLGLLLACDAMLMGRGTYQRHRKAQPPG